MLKQVLWRSKLGVIQCSSVARHVSHRRHYLGRDTFDQLVTLIVSNLDVKNVPKSKEEAVKQVARQYISRELAKGNHFTDFLKNYQAESYMDVFEKDDTYVIDRVVQHLQLEIINKSDEMVRSERSRVKRFNAPLKNYAVFLKYIYEEVPDMALIERFYNKLPHPPPLYIKPLHFEKLMGILVGSKESDFFVKVVSDLRSVSFNLTLDEKSKLITNILLIGHSSKLLIYEFTKSKIPFDNIQLYNAVLRYCVNFSRSRRLFEAVLSDMRSNGVKVDSETFSLMLRMYSHLGTRSEVVKLLQFLKGNTSLCLDINLINSMIFASIKFKHDIALQTLKRWLLEVSQLKSERDTYKESIRFLQEYSKLLSLSSEAKPLAYLPNIDEHTIHILAEQAFNQSRLEGNVGSVLDLLKIADNFDLKIWEASYKYIYKKLLSLDTDCYSLKDLQVITQHYMVTSGNELLFSLSNPVFRKTLFRNFQRVSPDEKFRAEVEDSEATIKDLYDEFYASYPKGFDTRDLKKVGSSKLFEVVTKATIAEIEDLVQSLG